MVAADEESGLRRQELRFVKGMFVRIEAQCEQRRPCTAANAQLRLDCIGRESLTIFREPARQPHTGDKAMDGSDRDRNDADVMASLPAGLHPFIVATVLFAEAPAVNAHGLQEHGHASLFGSQRVKTKCPTAVWRTLLPERSFPRECTQRHVAYTVSSLTFLPPLLLTRGDGCRQCGPETCRRRRRTRRGLFKVVFEAFEVPRCESRVSCRQRQLESRVVASVRQGLLP